MARICCEKPRDKHDHIIVQEKLDGSNVAVAKIDGVLHPLIRAGWLASSSNHEQHRLFHVWAMENAERFNAVLKDGERLCGEWLAVAHGTRYDLTGREPFVAFDIIGSKGRFVEAEFEAHVAGTFRTPQILAFGPCSIDKAMELLGTYGHYGALDPAEGCVWRVERKGKVDFLAKFVRADKVDGAYFPEISGQPEVWNWRP